MNLRNRVASPAWAERGFSLSRPPLPARPALHKTKRQIEDSARSAAEYEARRARETETRALYRTVRWFKIRSVQLNAQPLCVKCKDEDRLTAATICDHVTPHRGNVEAFWSGPFQSLCASCHSSTKQREEVGSRRGGF
jgi:5-methylcytosine-specific restriction enzyme A